MDIYKTSLLVQASIFNKNYVQFFKKSKALTTYLNKLEGDDDVVELSLVKIRKKFNNNKNILKLKIINDEGRDIYSQFIIFDPCSITSNNIIEIIKAFLE